MARFITVYNQSNSDAPPIRAKYCAGFWSKFQGLMLHPPLQVNEGALLVEERDSKINSSIHMLFMRYDLCVIWINDAFQVVDIKLCRRWKLAYTPEKPARYILETHISQVNWFTIGDRVSFIHD